MQQSLALIDEDVSCAVRALAAEVQAALALSRATLQAVASLTPELAAAAVTAVEHELDVARERGAHRSVEVLAELQGRLLEIPEQVEMMGALERALVAAADALPEDAVLHAQ